MLAKLDLDLVGHTSRVCVGKLRSFSGRGRQGMRMEMRAIPGSSWYMVVVAIHGDRPNVPMHGNSDHAWSVSLSTRCLTSHNARQNNANVTRSRQGAPAVTAATLCFFGAMRPRPPITVHSLLRKHLTNRSVFAVLSTGRWASTAWSESVRFHTGTRLHQILTWRRGLILVIEPT